MKNKKVIIFSSNNDEPGCWQSAAPETWEEFGEDGIYRIFITLRDDGKVELCDYKDLDSHFEILIIWEPSISSQHINSDVSFYAGCFADVADEVMQCISQDDLLFIAYHNSTSQTYHDVQHCFVKKLVRRVTGARITTYSHMESDELYKAVVEVLRNARRIEDAKNGYACNLNNLIDLWEPDIKEIQFLNGFFMLVESALNSNLFNKGEITDVEQHTRLKDCLIEGGYKDYFKTQFNAAPMVENLMTFIDQVIDGDLPEQRQVVELHSDINCLLERGRQDAD